MKEWELRHKERVRKATEEHPCPVCKALVGMACDPLEPMGGTHIGRTQLVTIAERKVGGVGEGREENPAKGFSCGFCNRGLLRSDKQATYFVCPNCRDQRLFPEAGT
jgi:predicted RNA-binding Zn-ribbon protein involved in translation (DUF1610 family)